MDFAEQESKIFIGANGCDITNAFIEVIHSAPVKHFTSFAFFIYIYT